MESKGIVVHQISGNEIHYTNDYSKFILMADNRDVKDSREAKISASINEVGYIPVPILVNEKMEIIDGQGRYTALMKLGLPIAYVIVPNLGIRECIAMNISGTTWSNEDYIKSYATQGNENYERLRKLLYDEYPGQFRLTNVLMASIGKQDDTPSIRSGSIRLTEESMGEAYQLLDFVSNINKLLKLDGTYLPSKMANAIIFAIQVSGVDTDRLAKSIERNYNPGIDSGNLNVCLAWLSEIYNFGQSRSLHRYHFENEWEEAWENENSWYHAKWGHVKSAKPTTKQSLVNQQRFDFDVCDG